MIRKIKIQNIFGIDSLQELNFELSHAKETQINFQNGIVKTTNKNKEEFKIMLTPTLISKNATGKTSLLKAIKFMDSINSIDDLINIFFINIDNKFEAINERVLNEIERLGRFRNKNNISFKMIISIIQGKFFYNDEIHKEENEKKQIDFLKEEIFNKYKKQFNNINFFDTEHILYSNFLKSINKNKEIILEIKNTEAKFNKSIFINNKKIQFNEEEKGFEEIKNNILKSLNKKINNFTFWKLLEEKEIKKMKETHHYEDYFDKFENKNNLKSKVPLNQFIFINDQTINEKINSPNRNIWIKGKNNILNELISKTSFKLVNSIIQKIDPSISHIEKQSNGLYSIIDKDSEIKNFKTLSFGTIKILVILEKVLNSYKEENKLILIDEIENGLNLSLINLLIKIITNKSININKNQILITTHNPSLMSEKIINPSNAFLYFDNKFKNSLDIVKRTEDLDSIFKNKNFYNQVFWGRQPKLSKEKQSTSTIFDEETYDILDLIEERSNEEN